MTEKISATKIIMMGQLMVNIPVTLCIILVIYLGIQFSLGWTFTAILASGIGWIAWDFLIEKWKYWAVSKGVDRDRLFKLGKIGLINFYHHRIYVDK